MEWRGEAKLGITVVVDGRRLLADSIEGGRYVTIEAESYRFNKGGLRSSSYEFGGRLGLGEGFEVRGRLEVRELSYGVVGRLTRSKRRTRSWERFGGGKSVIILHLAMGREWIWGYFNLRTSRMSLRFCPYLHNG